MTAMTQSPDKLPDKGGLKSRENGAALENAMAP